MLDSRDLGRANSRAGASGRRVNVDQDFRGPNPINGTQGFFRIILDRGGNVWIVGRKRQLHLYFAVVDLDRLNQAKRNDVAAEAGISNRLERVCDLFFRNRHSQKLARENTE